MGVLYYYCTWSPNGKCEKRIESSHADYFYEEYDACNDDSKSLQTQSTYCGRPNLASDGKSMEVSLAEVNDLYGVDNLYCKYAYQNVAQSPELFFNVEVKAGATNSISLIVKTKFTDNTFSHNEIKTKNFKTTMKKAKEITIYYLSDLYFGFNPFTIRISEKESGISTTTIILIAVFSFVIVFLVFFGIIFYLCKKRRGQIRMIYRRNIHEYPSQFYGQSGMMMPVQNLEDMKKMKMFQLEETLTGPMKSQPFKKDLSKYNSKCQICSKEFSEATMVSLTPCSHLYHHDCLKGWLMSNLFMSKCLNCNYFLLPDQQPISNPGIYPNNYAMPPNNQIPNMNNAQNVPPPSNDGIGYKSIELNSNAYANMNTNLNVNHNLHQ